MSNATAEQALTSPLREDFPDGTTPATIGAAVVAWDFGDAAAEYAAIRGDAARIDLSGAGLVEVTGDGAYDLVQLALARDLEFVTPEQSLIGALLDGDGVALDLVTAYHSGEGYLLETSIGRGPGTADHLRALAGEAGLDVEVRLVNDERTIILIEGPRAAKVVEEVIDPDLSALPLSGLLELTLDGMPLTVSRSGFTGEYGYKVFARVEDAPAVWRALQVIPAAGIGALEVAMFEVRQPLVHRETDPGANVLQLGLAWMVDITKEEFHGRDAVQAAFDAGVRSEVIGFGADGDAPPAVGTPVQVGATAVGRVLYAVHSPGRGGVVGLLRMRPDLVTPSLDVTLGEAAAPARTLYSPYVVPASWKTR